MDGDDDEEGGSLTLYNRLLEEAETEWQEELLETRRAAIGALTTEPTIETYVRQELGQLPGEFLDCAKIFPRFGKKKFKVLANVLRQVNNLRRIKLTIGGGDIDEESAIFLSTDYLQTAQRLETVEICGSSDCPPVSLHVICHLLMGWFCNQNNKPKSIECSNVKVVTTDPTTTTTTMSHDEAIWQEIAHGLKAVKHLHRVQCEYCSNELSIAMFLGALLTNDSSVAVHFTFHPDSGIEISRQLLTVLEASERLPRQCMLGYEIDFDDDASVDMWCHRNRALTASLNALFEAYADRNQSRRGGNDPALLPHLFRKLCSGKSSNKSALFLRINDAQDKIIAAFATKENRQIKRLNTSKRERLG